MTRARRADEPHPALVALALLVILAAFAIAGTMDYYDATHGLAVDMMPARSE